MRLEKRRVEAILVRVFEFRGVRVHNCVSVNAVALIFLFFSPYCLAPTLALL
jgi:hypothetical protein